MVGDRCRAGLPGRPGVCELVGAVRGLRLGRLRPATSQLGRAFDRADAVLPGALADRPLDEDLAAAGALLDTLGDVLAESAGAQVNPVGSAR